MKKILYFILAAIGIVISVLILFFVITYVASQYQNKNEIVISFCSAIMAINAIITLYNNFFPQKNKELEELIEIKKEIQNIKDNIKNKEDIK